MAASPVSVVARAPNAPEIIRPPARTGAFLQTLRSLAEHVPRSLHPMTAGRLPAESKNAERCQAHPGAGEREAQGSAEQAPPEPDRACSEGEVAALSRVQSHEDGRLDVLDPSWRALAALVPIERAVPAAPTERAERVRSASLEQLFGSLVKRVAWSTTADRSSATLRLEIGAGELAGATILITADPRELCVVLDAPPGIDLEAWKNRLSQRLASKGLAATFS